MAVKRKYRLNLRNYGNLPAIMLSQYDEGYALEFEIRDGTDAASDLSAYTVTLKGTRADTLAYSLAGTVSTNVLTFIIDTTMTACAGRGTAEIAIKDTANDVLFATFNMPVFVERAAVPEGSIDADVERAQEIAEQIQEIVDNAAAEVKGEAESWAVGQRDGTDVPATDPTYHNNAKYYSEQAQQAADSIGIDATLTQAGKAADAKKTGDEINELKEGFNDLIIISDEQPTAENNKIWIDSNSTSVQVPTMDEYNVLLNNLPTATASGSVVYIVDGANNTPIKSLSVESDATKITQLNKNIFPLYHIIDLYNKPEGFYHNGVYYTLKPDGGVHCAGTVVIAGWNFCQLYSDAPLSDFGLAVGDTVNLSINAGHTFVAFKNSEKTRISTMSSAGGQSKTATIPQGAEYIEIVLYCKNDQVVVGEEIDLDIYPILERGNTATSWEKPIRNTYNLTNGALDQTINTLLGVNQMFADSGNISVEYRQDIKMLISALA